MAQYNIICQNWEDFAFGDLGAAGEVGFRVLVAVVLDGRGQRQTRLLGPDVCPWPLRRGGWLEVEMARRGGEGSKLAFELAEHDWRSNNVQGSKSQCVLVLTQYCTSKQ